MAARMIWMRRLELQRKMDVDLVVMDCIGYNIGMKEQFQKLSWKTGDFIPDTCSSGYDGAVVIRGGKYDGTGGNWKKYFNKLHECQTRENVLIVTDDEKYAIGQALYQAAKL